MTWNLFIEYFITFWFWIGVMVNLIIVTLVVGEIYTTIRVKVKCHKIKKYVNDYRISYGDWTETNPDSKSYIGKPPTINSAPKTDYSYLNDPDYYGD